MKLRIFYIASLLILGVLLVFAVFRPVATVLKHSEVQREQLLERDNEYIIQLVIINNEGEDKQYTINIFSGSYQHNQEVLILDGRRFTLMHHVRRDQLTEGSVNIAIYKKGEPIPFEQVTYHLSPR